MGYPREYTTMRTKHSILSLTLVAQFMGVAAPVVDEFHTEGTVTVPGYTLCYVCENAGGVCYLLRQDFASTVHIDADAPTLK